MVYIFNNIKYLRKLRGVNQEALATEIGVLRTTISNYEKNISTPDYETLIKIANYFDISIDDIITEDLSEKDAHLLSPKLSPILSPNGNLTPKKDVVSDTLAEYKKASKEIQKSQIPFYPIEASAGLEFFFNDVAEVATEYISVPFNFQGCIAIPIYGSSMEPEYKSGDIVIIHEIKDFSIINYGFPYIIITEEMRLFKIVRKGSVAGELVLHSLNSSFEDLSVKVSKIRKLFIVDGLISKKST